MSSSPLPYCSFCGKGLHEVRKLIAGPTVPICDECIVLCMSILTDDGLISHASQPLTITERLGGIDRAMVRLRAFELLKGWGTTAADGKFHPWGVTALKDRAEALAEWALAEPLTVQVVTTADPAPAADDIADQPQG